MFNLIRNLKEIKALNAMRAICVCSFLIVMASISGCSDTNKNENKKEESNKNIQMEKTVVEGSVYERIYSPHIGSETAKVTIVEFFDPACKACRAFYPIVKEMMSRHPDDVRLVLRYAAFHEGSEIVVRILETARLQNVFGPVLAALLKDQQQWASHNNPNLNKAWEIAEEAGLNVSLAKEAMSSEEISEIIAQENKDIQSLGVKQTPTFFVNERPLESFGAQQLYELIVSELKK